MYKFVVQAQKNGSTVGNFLKFCGVSTAYINAVKYLENGITVNGARCFTTHKLCEGDVLVLAAAPQRGTSVVAANLPFEVVYEDEHVLVANKPAGMPTHPSHKHFEDTLGNAYVHFMQQRGEQAPVYRPINRLDRNTSGLVLIAKSQLGAALVAQNIKKTYYAVVHGVPQQAQGVIDAPIERATASIITRRVGTAGSAAQTAYKVLQACGPYALIQCTPLTGRTHQIRVHFAHIGHPLAGDDLYGGSREHINRHALHCGKLVFQKVLGEQQITVQCPLAQDMMQLVGLA